MKYVDPDGREDWDSSGTSCTITPKDTLWKITDNFNNEHGTNISCVDAAKANGIENPDLIFAGNSLDFSSFVQGIKSDKQDNPEVNNDHHLRNGLLEIGAGIAILVLTGIEVRNTMAKDPESTTQVGYGGVLAGGTIIADGITRASGASKTTVKEDFMSLLESPLGSAIKEFNNPNTNGKGRAPGRTVDFSNKNSSKRKDE